MDLDPPEILLPVLVWSLCRCDSSQPRPARSRHPYRRDSAVRRQGYHTGLPHVKPTPENFLLRLHAPVWIMLAGELPPWMLHFHLPWFQKIVLDIGYTLSPLSGTQFKHYPRKSIKDTMNTSAQLNTWAVLSRTLSSLNAEQRRRSKLYSPVGGVVH